jgi:SAM-dependent methyltransferase
MENKIIVRYCSEAPSAQTALDIFKGAWKSALPPDLGLETGDKQGFHNDARVHWVASLLPNGFQGMSILELGPFEGYDSRLFEQLGAASVLAVEGNNINFLKCLVLKDSLGLNARFLHGDFLKYLQSSEQTFDIVWASGVLYHSEDPLELLVEIGRRTNRVFLWTHYFADSLLSTNHNREFIERNNLEQMRFGEPYTLHYRAYPHEQFKVGLPLYYEGGQQTFSFWLERRDIDRMLAAMGFQSVNVRQDGELNEMPFVSLYAERW